MPDITLKRKKKQKSSRLLDFIGEFIKNHVISKDGGEDRQALERRYVFLCARTLLGISYSFLIARAQLAFSAYPFGIMFLCAAGRGAPIYAAASLISSLTLGGVSKVYALSYALIIFARSLICIYFDAKEEGIKRFPLYNEWVAYRVIVSCIASFIVGLYNLFFFSFTYYSLLGSLLCMLLCPIGTYIFAVGADKNAREEGRDASRLFMCALLIWALSPISLFSINAGRIAAFCLVASESNSQKRGASALMGLVCGLPFGISSCAVYAIAGAVCATLKSLSEFLGHLGAFTFILMAEGYIGGYSALLSALPSSSVALTLVLLWEKLSISRRLCSFSLSSLLKKTKDENIQADITDKDSVSELSRAFFSLSSTLRSLSKHAERSILLDTNGICEYAFDKVCHDCPARAECREKNASTAADAQAKLASAVSRDGRISDKSLPPYLAQNCRRRASLVSEINRRCARMTEECFARSGTELLSADYASMAKILDSHLKRAKERDRHESELSAALLSLCKRKLYGISSVAVYGTRRRRIYASGIDLSSHTVSAAELQREFEAVCGCALSSPVYSLDEAELSFEMHSTPRFSPECAIAALPKECEEKSGDSARSFSNSEGYFYSILCDGMGSGETAAYTSGICAEYLSCMLSCSNPKEITLEMLNCVLREQRGESSSTVDMFEFDTFTGEGCFLKSGAAPSYVCRGKNVYRISAKTIPIGITEKICAEKIKFKLRRGDIVVMLSDGIVESEEDSRHTVETLCSRSTNDPFDIAAAVLCNARAKHSLRDDMTVVCTAIG